MDDGHIWLEVIVIILLVLANGVCSLAEIAIVGARKTKLQEMIDEGNKNAAYALRLAERKDELFAPEQLCLDRMALDGYYLRWYNKAIYLCDYREDGLTAGSWDLLRNNKMGYAMLSNLKLLTARQRKKQFTEAAQCIALSITAGYPSYIFQSNKPWMTLAAFPYGLFLSLRRRSQFRHDNPPGRSRKT